MRHDSDDSDFWFMIMIVVVAMMVTTMILVTTPGSTAADCKAAAPSQYRLNLDFNPERLCRRAILSGHRKRAEQLNAYFQKALNPDRSVRPGQCQASGEGFLAAYPTTLEGTNAQQIMTKICSGERPRRDEYRPFITAIFRAYAVAWLEIKGATKWPNPNPTSCQYDPPALDQLHSRSQGHRAQHDLPGLPLAGSATAYS